MKKKLFKRKPKRTTFLKMFVKAMILPVLFTCFIGYNLKNFGISYLQIEAEKLNISDLNSFVRQIEQGSELEQEWDRPIELPLTVSSVRVFSSEGIVIDTGEQHILATTYDDEKSASAKWSFDSEGNIIFSNRARLWALLSFGSTPEERQYFYYDPQDFDIPEMNSLFEDFFRGSEKGFTYGLKIRSVYWNKENNKIIPHVIEVSVYKDDLFLSDGQLFLKDDKHVERKEVVIDAGQYAEDFEYMEFTEEKLPDVYPKMGMVLIVGVNPVKFDQIYEQYKDVTMKPKYNQGMSSNDEYTYDFYAKTDLNENKYGASGFISVTRVNAKNRHSVIKFWFVLGAVFLISTLIAFVCCLVKNAKNKAQYAFEDYQRALTNNLAHDLKTPLAVIGGYAENLIEMRKDCGSEKELGYLSSIMKNVAYTDDIIAKTLKLSETEQIKKLNKTKVDIKELAESAADKYRTALEERNIELKIDAAGEVTADRDILGTAVENLVSNAVKYTRNDGTIKITADKKRLCVVNDIAENINTKDLLMPFVKGDKARSDKNGHGLGLAIANAAAARNGFRLKIDCRDKKFKATIEY